MIFINATPYRGLISKIYKELKKLDTKNPNNLIREWGTELIRKLSTEESGMVKKLLPDSSGKCKSKRPETVI